MSYVIYGERPAAIAICNILRAKGADRHNIVLVDKKGICYKNREEDGEGSMNEY